MAKPEAGTTFTVPPERYISAPSWDVFDHCKDLMQDQRLELWREVAQLVEGTSQLEFLALRRRIKRNFQTFAMAAQGKNAVGKAADQLSEASLDKEELKFMTDLVDLLGACHFRLLSQDDWDSAQAEEFTFTMPVEVDWQTLDKSLLSRFWASRPAEERDGIAAMADRILVFHRGVTLMKAKGSFIADKIDILVSYVIVQPLQHLWEKYVPENIKAYAPRLTVDVNEHMQSSEMTGHTGQPTDAPPSLSPGSALAHKYAQEVRRVTLKDLMPNTTAVLAKFLQTITIQEPGFKHVVILYRRKIPEKPEPKNEKAPIREQDPRLARRNIHIKRFDDIPMADAEMIFPDKRVYVKPLTLITLFVTVVLGLVACVSTFLSQEFSLGTFMTVLGIFGGRAYQVYYSATIARQQVMDQIMESLYEQTMDAQEGVLYYLLDQMADQHVKETLLAYALLLSSGKSMSRDQLDRVCEDHIAQHFGQEVDFAIERSLPELLSDGLVTEHAGLLTAEPLNKAHALLKQKWGTVFQAQQRQKQLAAAQPALGSSTPPSEGLQRSADQEDPQDERIKRLSQQSKTSYMAGNASNPRSNRPSRHPDDPRARKGLGSMITGIFSGSKHTGSKKRE